MNEHASTDIESNLLHIKAKIKQQASRVNRSADDITVLAVSKRKPALMIRQAYSLGQRDFGENYLQEAEQKMAELSDLAIIWHFIGPIQSNKTRAIAEHFEWVHSVDRIKIAARLNDQRPNTLKPLNICLQVNIDDEDSKAGVAINDVKNTAIELAAMPNLQLRGLMCIPNKVESRDKSRANAFVRLNNLQQSLKEDPRLKHLDTLSMGMSADMDAAIAAGTTIVRIGTAIFGAR